METLAFVATVALIGYKAACSQALEKRKIPGSGKEKSRSTQENENVDYQVLIVGAGPAGATAAYYLGKCGIQVLHIPTFVTVDP